MYFISRIIISFEQKEKKCLQKKKPLSQKTFAFKETSLKEFGYLLKDGKFSRNRIGSVR